MCIVLSFQLVNLNLAKYVLPRWHLAQPMKWDLPAFRQNMISKKLSICTNVQLTGLLMIDGKRRNVELALALPLKKSVRNVPFHLRMKGLHTRHVQLMEEENLGVQQKQMKMVYT